MVFLDSSTITYILNCRDRLRSKLQVDPKLFYVETYVHSKTHAKIDITIKLSNGTFYDIDILIPYECQDPNNYVQTNYPELYL